MGLFLLVLFLLRVAYGQNECNIPPQLVDNGYFNSCSNITLHNVSQLNVTDLIEIDNQVGFSITGDISITTLQCFGNSGFIFRNTSNVSLANIELVQCGFSHYHYHYDSNFSAAVFMIHCSNIKMMNAFFTNSNGVGLVLLNSRGNVEINHSRFDSGNVLKSIRNAA